MNNDPLRESCPNCTYISCWRVCQEKNSPLLSWLACSKMLWPTNRGPRGKIENSLALAYNKLPKASRKAVGYCLQYHIYLKLLININAWCIKVTFESKHLSGAFFPATEFNWFNETLSWNIEKQTEIDRKIWITEVAKVIFWSNFDALIQPNIFRVVQPKSSYF